ncbi:MAG: MFS transporter [Methylocystaceae bacterium]
MQKLWGCEIKRYRFVVIGFMVAIWFVVYIQRVNVSMLLVDAQFLNDMGLNGKGGLQGLLMTFFLIPYALTNILAAPLGDKIGPRKAMMIGIVIGVLGSITSGLVPTFAFLLTARLVLGVGQGIHFPNQSVFVRNWFPAGERGLGNALYAVGGCAAPMLTIPLYTWLFGLMGWRHSVMLVGLLSLLVALPLVIKWVTDTPDNNAFVSPEECAFIKQAHLEEASSTDAVEMGAAGQVVRSIDFWLITMAYFAYLAIWWGLVTWLPQYFVVARGLDLKTMGWATSIPYAAAAIAVVIGGTISDRLGKRSLLGMLVLTGSALCIVGGALVDSPGWCIFLVSAGVALDVVYYPIAWAILQSMLPANLIGTGSGIMNGTSNLLSAVTPFAMGILIQVTGTYNAGMYLLAVVGIIGACASLILMRRGK